MALSQIPNPYGIPWQTWVDTLVGFNPELLANISPDDPWEDVANRLVQYETQAPESRLFGSWQEWAAALKQAYPD